jgi:hypothetical protein
MVAVGLAALLLGVAGAGAPAAAGGRGHRHSNGHGHKHRPHFHGRVFIAPPVFVGPRFYVRSPYYPYPYAPYYYRYAPPVVVTSPPTTYIQRPPASDGYWHYCQDPAGYYPQVAQCPGGWIQVAPRSE